MYTVVNARSGAVMETMELSMAVLKLYDGAARRRRGCHSAAPPSPFSRCFNMDAEGMSSK